MSRDNDDSPFRAVDRDVVPFIRMIRQRLEAVVDLGRQRYGKLADGPVNLAGRWFSDMPILARAAADAYGSAPVLFPGSPCDSAQLRDLEEQVRVTGEFLMYLAATTDQVSAIYNAARKLLCDWTYGIADQVVGLEALPFIPAEQKALVRDVSPLIRRLLAERTAVKLATQYGNDKVKAVAEAKVAQVLARLASKEQEIAVLRGGSVPVDPPARPPRSGRRPRGRGRNTPRR